MITMVTNWLLIYEREAGTGILWSLLENVRNEESALVALHLVCLDLFEKLLVH